jgi:glutamate-5-semialdehyde dehydrogenase
MASRSSIFPQALLGALGECLYNATMTNDIAAYIADVGRNAREASRIIGSATSASKSEALKRIAEAVDAARENIRTENAKDMAAAEQNGIDQPLIDRLLLNDKGIDQMIEGILQVDALRDPVGEMSDFSYRPTGIQIGKMRVPLGVIAMIYESRPNVTCRCSQPVAKVWQRLHFARRIGGISF